MQALLKSFFSIFMAIVLVGSMCPMVAYAQPSQENSIEEGVNDQDSAELEGDQAIDAGNSSEQIYGEKQQVEPESESTDQALVSEETAEEQDAQDLETDTDPDAENSWRYSNGEVITSSEGANPDTADLNSGIMPFAMVENPAGYKVFNWFDKFNKGYYTGTNAYKGIDVSYHNGSIDWAKVKASGVDYAIIRCGYGMDQRDQDDEKWFENVQGCIENDIPFGVYLYSYATNTSRASSEADHALRLLREAGLDPSDVSYPIYFDMEDASTLNSDHAAIATTFCNKIEAAGYVAGVYSSTSWFNDRLTDSCFNNWTKWVAQWNASSGLTYDGLSDFSSGNGMWQFSDYGSVPGISGAVDLNYTCMEPLMDLTLNIEGIYTDVDCQFVSSANESLVLTSEAEDVSGSNVNVMQNNLASNQIWKIVAKGKGLASIQSSANGNFVLDAAGTNPTDGANVSIWEGNGGNNQKWLITPTEKEKEYTIGLANNNSLLLDAAGEKPFNGANVAVYSSNGGANQKWKIRYSIESTSVSVAEMERNNTGSPLKPTIEVSFFDEALAEGTDYKVLYNGSETVPNSPGTYKVGIEGINGYFGTKEVGEMVIYEAADVGDGLEYRFASEANSGLVLDAAGVNPVSGAAVTLYAANGGDNQSWSLTLGEDGYYTIVNAANNSLVLDAAGVNPVSGAKVSLYAANGGNNQKWQLEDANDIESTSVSVAEMERNNTGSPLKPTIEVSFFDEALAEGTDYKVLYNGSETVPNSPGTYKVGIEGINGYFGTKEVGEMVIYEAADVGDGLEYRFASEANSGLVLDAAGVNPVSGAKVSLYAANGGNNQKWIMVKTDKGYELHNAANNSLVLDAAGVNPVSGAKVSLYAANGGNNQKWQLIQQP